MLKNAKIKMHEIYCKHTYRAINKRKYNLKLLNIYVRQFLVHR